MVGDVPVQVPEEIIVAIDRVMSKRTLVRVSLEAADIRKAFPALTVADADLENTIARMAVARGIPIEFDDGEAPR
jgi:hypothetical protein